MENQRNQAEIAFQKMKNMLECDANPRWDGIISYFDDGSALVIKTERHLLTFAKSEDAEIFLYGKKIEVENDETQENNG